MGRFSGIGAAPVCKFTKCRCYVTSAVTTAVQAASCQMDEVTVIGRSRKRKLELDCSYVTEQLTVDGQQYTFRQVQLLT